MNTLERYGHKTRTISAITVAAGLLTLTACTSESNSETLHKATPSASAGKQADTRRGAVCGISRDGATTSDYGRQALERAKEVVDRLEGKYGVSDDVTRAIAATMMVESCLDPTARAYGDKTGAHGKGLLMWARPGQARLQAYAAEHGGDPNSLATQTSFALEDIRTNYRSTYTTLQNATDTPTAVRVLVDDYIRPVDSDRQRRMVIDYAEILESALTIDGAQ